MSPTRLPPPQRPRRSEFGRFWVLDPQTAYLNHGSYGACPLAVLEEQSRLRALLEADPMAFFHERGVELWQQALHCLADFLHADPAGMAFVSNATSGVNTVLRSLALAPRDEIIVSDHAYQACRNAIDYVCARSGARPVVVATPFPVESPEPIVEGFLRAVTGRSRLAMVDTVTSPTALRMPFERLTRELQGRGVDVLIDGAHGPGLLPLDLEALGAAWVTGNCHKWLCTPKGSGFLHARADRRRLLEPLTISHGYSAPVGPAERFRQEFDWQGTRDPTPWLCIPAAIAQLGGMLPGGWDAVMARNRALALSARGILCDALGTREVLPESLLTAMVTFPLRAAEQDENVSYANHPLTEQLYAEHAIRAVVFPWPPHRALYLRVSAALYNSEEEFRYLADALTVLGVRG
jgi:isopenicillin-N epimerase